MTVRVQSSQGTSLLTMHVRRFFLNFCGTTVPGQTNAARVNCGGAVPDLTLPSHTALRLGAIHKTSRLANLMSGVNSLCFCMCASTSDMDHGTLYAFDPLN